MPFLGTVGPFELIIVLVIVILIFGVGKLPDIGGALGKSIREFKAGVSDEDEKKKAAEEKPKA
ncbi:MAG: twin-arginine translocase TatA/TatE family subunit [Chloroflexi bacterium]|nr:twin-arginine translocase TatA/TatE family subunit [Chloroflexota bacterium]